MSLFRYETHLHTSEASACAIFSAKEHVRYYKAAGYDGIVVTDHFFNGNTCIPAGLPWEERVDLFCRGYENAKAEGDKLGLKVFFGWEANFAATEFLVYGLDKAWLLNHPEVLSWPVEEHYRRIHEAGGFVVHAHPYRIRPYIKEIRLFPKLVDAVEAVNLGNHNDTFDRQALVYARKHKLPVTAGTDAHGNERLHSGMAFSYEIENIQDFIEGIRAGKGELLKPR